MNAIPRSGLHIPLEFTDKDGVLHRADSWEALARQVFEYRSKAQFLIGDPLTEIYAQVCAQYPERCKNLIKKTPKRHRELNRRILDWVVQLLVHFQNKTLIRQADDNEVSRRSEICRKCPKQSAWRGTCQNCAAQVSQILSAVLKGVPLDSGLQGCLALGEDTRASVRIEQPGSDDPHLPEFCWRRA